MNRKQMLKLLNGIKNGYLPISAVFDDWPEKKFYAIQDDDEHYETEEGDIVSYLEVDAEAMNYPKVRVISKEPEDKDVKISINHKYVDFPESCSIPFKEPADLQTEIKTIEPKPPPEPDPVVIKAEEYKPQPLYCIR